MATATITSKGQVTIPKEVREALGLSTGDRLEFRLLEAGDVRLSVRRRLLSELAGMLHRKGEQRLSVAEMEEAIGRGVVMGS